MNADHAGKQRPNSGRRGLSRREVLGLGGALAIGGGIFGFAWRWKSHERGRRADVFIGKAGDYDERLAAVVADGLKTLGIGRAQIRGKRILLKPNLVETAPGIACINTNPAMVLAAAQAFRRLDAGEVIVAEGQGHRRDSLLVLEESGMQAALEQERLGFVDLNHDDFAPVANAGNWTDLPELHLPKTLLSADWIVSMPKLKTHHWAGVTCAMKNLFGVMPGVVYGWPKNVLHYAGIDRAVLDINAAVRPHLAIVDGVVGMEGDGPIMGNPKKVGCVVIGRNFPAVDATCVRIMGLNPYGVRYLNRSSGRLGPIHAHNITQHGEPIAAVQTRFRVLDLPHLRSVAQV